MIPYLCTYHISDNMLLWLTCWECHPGRSLWGLLHGEARAGLRPPASTQRSQCWPASRSPSSCPHCDHRWVTTVITVPGLLVSGVITDVVTIIADNHFWSARLMFPCYQGLLFTSEWEEPPSPELSPVLTLKSTLGKPVRVISSGQSCASVCRDQCCILNQGVFASFY